MKKWINITVQIGMKFILFFGLAGIVVAGPIPIADFETDSNSKVEVYTGSQNQGETDSKMQIVKDEDSVGGSNKVLKYTVEFKPETTVILRIDMPKVDPKLLEGRSLRFRMKSENPACKVQIEFVKEDGGRFTCWDVNSPEKGWNDMLIPISKFVWNSYAGVKSSESSQKFEDSKIVAVLFVAYEKLGVGEKKTVFYIDNLLID